MKNLFFWAACLCCTASGLSAQDLVLGLYPLQSGSHLNGDQRRNVEAKLRSLVGAAGAVAGDALAQVGLSTSWNQYEPRTVSAGTRNLTVIDAEITFTAQQRDGKTVFGTFQKKISGSGTDLRQAQSSLLTAMPSNDAGFSRFLTQSKTAIGDYYAKNCTEIMAEADRAANTGNGRQALSTLLNIPAATPCRQEADAKLLAVYARQRDQMCQQYLTQARAAAAAKDYRRAVDMLKFIDPEAACYAQATAFIAELNAQVNADYRAELDTLQQWLTARTDIEKFRVNLIRDFLMR